MIRDWRYFQQVQRKIKPCPICDAPALLVTFDYMTMTVMCSDYKCGCKIERGIAGARSFRQAMKSTINRAVKAWNNRS